MFLFLFLLLASACKSCPCVKVVLSLRVRGLRVVFVMCHFWLQFFFSKTVKTTILGKLRKHTHAPFFKCMTDEPCPL